MKFPKNFPTEAELEAMDEDTLAQLEARLDRRYQRVLRVKSNCEVQRREVKRALGWKGRVREANDNE